MTRNNEKENENDKRMKERELKKERESKRKKEKEKERKKERKRERKKESYCPKTSTNERSGECPLAVFAVQSFGELFRCFLGTYSGISGTF